MPLPVHSSDGTTSTTHTPRSSKKPSETPSATPVRRKIAPASTAVTSPTALHASTSNPILLLRNLHFLDLDILPDWPQLTAETFRSGGRDIVKGQKDRIRAAEWLLYHLFSVWDAREAKSKLYPFYPALEPRQSIKLRAALLQWLMHLKTTGVIGKECMIRKSMLDECRGERFEEVLLHLSAAVFEKVVKAKARKDRLPVAQHLATKQQWSGRDWDTAGVLKWAHDASLRRSSDERARTTSKLRSLDLALMNKAQALESEKKLAEVELGEHATKLKQTDVDSTELKKRIRSDCRGDPQWLSILISGDAEHDRDATIEDDFDSMWQDAMGGGTTVHSPSPIGLLAELEQRVKDHKARLHHWRTFQQELSQRNKQFIVSQSPFKSPVKSPGKPGGGSPPKRTPKRQLSTRKADSTRVRDKSTRLQELQMSPTKPREPVKVPEKGIGAHRSGVSDFKLAMAAQLSEDMSGDQDSFTQQPHCAPPHGHESSIPAAVDRDKLAASGTGSDAPTLSPTRQSKIPSPARSPTRRPIRRENVLNSAAPSLSAIEAHSETPGEGQARTHANADLLQSPTLQIASQDVRPALSASQQNSQARKPLSSPVAFASTAPVNHLTSPEPRDSQTQDIAGPPHTYLESLHERTQRTLALLQSHTQANGSGNIEFSSARKRHRRSRSLHERHPINPFGAISPREGSYEHAPGRDTSHICTLPKDDSSSTVPEAGHTGHTEESTLSMRQAVPPINSLRLPTRDIPHEFIICAKEHIQDTPPMSAHQEQISPSLGLAFGSSQPPSYFPKAEVVPHTPPQQPPAGAPQESVSPSRRTEPDVFTQQPQAAPFTTPLQHHLPNTATADAVPHESAPKMPRTPPPSLPDAGAVDATSVFMTRSRLRRSPVGSPSSSSSPWG